MRASKPGLIEAGAVYFYFPIAYNDFAGPVSAPEFLENAHGGIGISVFAHEAAGGSATWIVRSPSEGFPF